MSNLSVEISGNLLSESILESLAGEASKHAFTKPESFRWYKYDVVDSQSIHLSRIAEAYESLKTRWDMLSSSFEEIDISDLREKWIKYLFSLLGYDLEYQKADIAADSGNKFCLSHRGWDGQHAPIIHTVLFSQDLDKKPDDGRHKYSPHDTLQRYLNQADDDLWAIVTNGKELRILRDFHHETRQAYVEFDLELIFEGRNYNDFRLLWRLMHPSRFISNDEEKCILETLFEESKNAGLAIGEHLQKNIRLAIESFGNGFLLSTPGLIEELIDNNEKCLNFYKQVLRVIYRVLFLFYAEQRKLMPTHSALYAQEYSLSSLRDKIESKLSIDSQHTDIWEGLKVTFKMVYEGVPELGITAFNGQLFSSDNIDLLNNSICGNDKLLETIKYMSMFEKEGLSYRISYVELSVDEIGAIYESLLEYIPRICSNPETFEDAVFGNRRNRERQIPPRTFFLDPRGTSRKTSGSYYTNPGLVNALIESALVPVLDTKLEEAGPNKDAQEKALLSLKVCDPACGSAAFLIAATEYLGEQLAKIRTQNDYPSDIDVRHARRDALRHCIYGVDINPMSVELAKVSLWLTAATNDQPLNFLDHHIKCGNSLIGATPELIEKSIPPDAYTAVEGDNKELVKVRKKLVREYYRDQTRGQMIMSFGQRTSIMQEVDTKDLSELFEENTTSEIREIEGSYKTSRGKEEFLKNKYIADYWTAAFFWTHDNEHEDYPRPEVLERMVKDNNFKINKSVKDEVAKLAEEYKFFQWHLEFPEVFTNCGFDCVLGNPPWEKIKLQEKEFFSNKSLEITNASNASIRKRMIGNLSTDDTKLFTEYKKALMDSEKLSGFIRHSNKYPLAAVGDINTYPIFAEIFVNMLNDNGYAGIIVPTGIATDNSTKEFFANLVKKKQLVSLYDFENSKGLFPEVHRSFKFCLLTTSNKPVEEANFSFFLTRIEHLGEDIRRFTLGAEDIELINPNTHTTPVFRTKIDAELTKKIYRNVPVLVNEEKCENPWGICFMTMFHMSNDSQQFCSEAGNGRFPLYEAKMIEQYDHRFAGVIHYAERIRTGEPDETTFEQHSDPNYLPNFRYWVNKDKVYNKISHTDKTSGFIVYKDITTASSERTLKATIIPYSAVGNTSPIILCSNTIDVKLKLCLLGNLNSLIVDFIARQKIGYLHINFFMFKQFTIIPPECYSQLGIDFISSRVFELVYTSYDLQHFAKDMGYNSPPFKWDENRRALLKAELDAYYAILYGLTSDELRYILDPQDSYGPKFPGETFRVLKEKEIRQYGEYQTKRLILEKYEEFKPMFH